MRIGINMLFLLPGETGGIQTYAQGLLEALGRIDAKNRYVLFVSNAAREVEWDLPETFERVVLPFDGRRRWMRYLWEQFVLPWMVLVHQLDVMHSLAYVGPMLAPCASVVTTHDVNFLAWGRHTMPWLRRLVMGGICAGLAHRAQRVLTVSKFSRREIARYLGVPLRKIVVAYNATEGRRQSETSPSLAEAAAAPYVIAFGGGDENKNIPRLVEAFARMAPALPHRLVLIGRIPRAVEMAIRGQPAEISARIHCIGYVARDAVERWLAGAELFVFPSFYEGFGLPILEAQAADVPVACSRAASLPEVAGEAAVFFDPHSAENIATVVTDVLRDAERRGLLRAKGRENIKRFSWSQSARRTLEVYDHVARNGALEIAI